MSNVSVIVCDTAARASKAREALLAGGYNAVSVQGADSVSFDAQTYVGVDGAPEGHTVDLIFDAWVVVGRKP